jgi:hypothetical protein
MYQPFCRLVLVTVLVQALGGCNSSPSAPSAILPPAPQPVPPQAQPPQPPQQTGILVAGKVTDTAWRPLAGARVEVVTGPQAGLSTIADARGEFRLSGDFDETTQFRASTEGHADLTRPLPARCAPCNPHWWVYFALESVIPTPNIAGVYTVTMIADSSCTNLPDELRTRTYQAAIAMGSSSSSFNVTMSEPSFIDDYNSFQIGVAGHYLAGFMGNLHGAPGLVDQIAPNKYVGFGGAFEGAALDSPITTTFDGVFEYCDLKSEWGQRYSCSNGDPAVTRAQCTSTKHQLVLQRR